MERLMFGDRKEFVIGEISNFENRNQLPIVKILIMTK